MFDTCLKYEDEQIKFDFDNPGERSFVDEVEMEEKALQISIKMYFLPF